MRGAVFLVAFVATLANTAAAQRSSAISGEVSDSADRPLNGAAVTIKAAANQATVTGAMTNAQGRFRIEGLSPGRYQVHISYLGYTSAKRETELTVQAPAANLGKIHLATSAVEVAGVTATALRSSMTAAADRNIYSTKNMPAASGGSTTDLLRNIPELDVDPDGNVKLQGSQSVALHINGRPTPMSGDALKSFLQTLPANRIAQVEVMPNPSAKYDPEGIAGIVNIVLKDNMDLGASGSLSLSADSRGRHNVGASLNYQKGALTLFGNGSFNLNANSMHLTDLRQNLLASPTTFFSNDAHNQVSGHFAMFDLSAEYKLGKTKTLYLTFRQMAADNDFESLQINRILDALQQPTARYDWDNNNNFIFGNSDAALGLRRVIKPQQNELTAELHYTGSLQSSEQHYVKSLIAASAADEHGVTSSETDLGELSAKVDYTQQLAGPKVKLETGYKGALRGTDYGNVLDRFSGSESTAFADLRTNYTYEENYQQVYALATRQFGKLGVQAGARGEAAHTAFNLDNGARYETDYNNIFPSVNLSYSKNAGMSTRLSYSKRLDRPQPFMMNPGQPSADSLNRFVGNPELEPKYTHSLTLDMTLQQKWGSFKLSPYYRKTLNNWDMFKIVNEAGVSTITWQNTNSVVAYGSNMTVTARAGAGTNGFVSLNMYRFQRDASNLSAAYSGDGFRWDISGNATATIAKGLIAQGFVRYTGAQDMPQGKISPGVFSNVGLRKQLLNNKAAINASLQDPFGVFRFKFETRDATHSQKSENKIAFRSLRVGVTYNFGRPPTPSVRKQDDQQQQPPADGQQIR